MARFHRLNRYAMPAAVALIASGSWLAFPRQCRWEAVNGGVRTLPPVHLVSGTGQTYRQSAYFRPTITSINPNEIGVSDQQACMCVALMTSFLWLPCFAPLLAILSGRVVRAEQKQVVTNSTPVIYTAAAGPRKSRRQRRRISA